MPWLVGTVCALFLRVPSSFLPEEDQGRLFVLVSLPPGATQNRTLDAVRQVENYFLDEEKDNVEGMFGVGRIQLRRARPERRTCVRQFKRLEHQEGRGPGRHGHRPAAR